MPAMLEVDSPEDFSNPALANLDRALRCTICQEFFTAPVLLTGCSHSFCSSCLRDHLSLQGHDSCPSCSVKASDSHIKRVPAMEEVVTRWKEARPALLSLLALQAAQANVSASNGKSEKVNGKKRKLDSPVESRKKKGKSKAVESDSDIEEIVDPTNPKAIVPCPICNESMRNEQMMSHLERAHPEPKKGKKKAKNDLFNTMMEGGGARPKKKSNVDLTKRLSKPIYRLLDLQTLKEHLTDVELFEPKRDKSLSKEQLEARHKHYVNLHNANLDASEQHRKPLKELRTQVMQSEKQATPAKEMDLKEHEKKNRSHFAELEKSMRARASSSKEATKVEEEDSDRSAQLQLGSTDPAQEESIASDSSEAEHQGDLEGLISDEEMQVDQIDPFQIIVEPAELEEEEERDVVPELETSAEEKMRLANLSPFDWPAPRASQRDKSERPIVV